MLHIAASNRQTDGTHHLELAESSSGLTKDPETLGKWDLDYFGINVVPGMGGHRAERSAPTQAPGALRSIGYETLAGRACCRIQSVTICKTSGLIVSSIWPYSEMAPVSQCWKR